MAVVNGGDPNYLLAALEPQNPQKNKGFKPMASHGARPRKAICFSLNARVTLAMRYSVVAQATIEITVSGIV